MIAGKWLARITEGDHRFPGKQIRQRDVCRIIIVAVRQDEIGIDQALHLQGCLQ